LGWQQRGVDLLIPDKPNGEAGASVDLSEDGESLIIGGPLVNTDNGIDSGSAAILDW
jgi:hypothetical protein